MRDIMLAKTPHAAPIMEKYAASGHAVLRDGYPFIPATRTYTRNATASPANPTQRGVFRFIFSSPYIAALPSVTQLGTETNVAKSEIANAAIGYTDHAGHVPSINRTTAGQSAGASSPGAKPEINVAFIILSMILLSLAH